MHFLVDISQSVQTFHHFQTQKVSIMSRFLDKPWFPLAISTVLTRQSLDWKVLILKILTETKKVCLDSWENLDRFQKLILTDWEILILILIGLDCGRALSSTGRISLMWLCKIVVFWTKKLRFEKKKKTHFICYVLPTLSVQPVSWLNWVFVININRSGGRA